MILLAGFTSFYPTIFLHRFGKTGQSCHYALGCKHSHPNKVGDGHIVMGGPQQHMPLSLGPPFKSQRRGAHISVIGPHHEYLVSGGHHFLS